MREDEERVVAAFAAWLGAQGWDVQREVEYCDVVATRGSERLYAEAKGRTSSPGLDVDTMYGQLLRRMPKHALREIRRGLRSGRSDRGGGNLPTADPAWSCCQLNHRALLASALLRKASRR